MIKLRSLAAIRSRNTSREQCHSEPESAQQCGEGAVQLVAESAAAKDDNFIQNCRFVNRDFSAEMNIQILERYCHQMCAVQGAQSLSVCLRWTGVMDTGQIRRSVD